MTVFVFAVLPEDFAAVVVVVLVFGLIDCAALFKFFAVCWILLF